MWPPEWTRKSAVRPVNSAMALVWPSSSVHDILDVTGAQEVFGKPIGSDKSEGKVTFVDLLGVDGCQREVEAQTKRAKAAVAGWADSDFLRELADRMVLRVK